MNGPEMGAGLEQSAPEATYKKGDLIGGKYELHSLLGRGGFGEVYLVYSRQLREALALKTFCQKFLADAEAKENFKREALIWVNLDAHPFILAARFVEEISGRLFVAMDYIAPDERGRVTLADHLAYPRGPLDTDQALQWAIMFCHGMEHANQRGIKRHRDIKPANILIRQDGTLLISDFGLAAAAEGAWERQGGSWESAGEEGLVGLSLFQTEGKQVCGTPGYLAPEVFRGEGAGVRSDIYSFGLVLWQTATGSQVPPFAAGVAAPESLRDIDRYAFEIYERQMRERAPAVGKPLEVVLGRCLAPEPLQRYGSFRELRGELETLFRQRTGRSVEVPAIYAWAVPFWVNKGASLRSLERYDEAVTCFKKALEIAPDDALPHHQLGIALQAKGDIDGALAEFRTALRVQPDDAILHNNLGAALDANGDIEAAIAEWYAALRLEPDLAAAHANLGLALKGKGDVDGAIAEYRTALRLQPDVANAHNILAVALAEKRDLDGAIAEYRTALRLRPDDAVPHYNLGNALKAKGHVDEAIAEYRTALRLQPDYALAHINLGNALRAKGDLDGAVIEYRTAVRLQPNSAMAHTNLGTGLSDKGDLDGAIVELRTAIRLQPDHAAAHRNLAIALQDKGDLDGAIAEYRTALRLRPNHAAAHCDLGSALAGKGDLNGAIAEYRTALRLQPDFAMAHNNLGVALWTKGDREAAVEEFLRAYRLAPNEPAIRQTYEYLMRQLKR